MANWIKQVNKDIRISDKLCAELTIGKRKVFFNAEDVEAVLTLGKQLHEFMTANKDFTEDAYNSREAQAAEEYLAKQQRVVANKRIKELQSQKETLQRKFGAASAPIVATLEAEIMGLMLQAS